MADTVINKYAESRSHAMTIDTCEHCGTKWEPEPRPCPVCGAPQCCPKCCLEALDDHIADGHAVPLLLRPLAAERLEEACHAQD